MIARWTYSSESVFAFSLVRNLENFISTRTATHSSPCIGISMAALLLHTQYGCGVLFICAKVFQNLEPDKRIDSTLSFFYSPKESGCEVWSYERWQFEGKLQKSISNPYFAILIDRLWVGDMSVCAYAQCYMGGSICDNGGRPGTVIWKISCITS